MDAFEYDENHLKELLASQGCDMDQLYEKYSSTKKTTSSYSPNNPSADDESTNEKNSPRIHDSSILNGLHICHYCNGLGIRKEIYNHVVLDCTCTECDGNGVVPRQK